MRLEIKDLRVAYGKIEAIKGISIVVEQGEIVSLIGANGAGKTTLLKTISGLLNPTSGSIEYDGKNILKYKAHERVSLGISQAPEGRGIFPGMTVLENLELGKYHLKMRKVDIDEDLVRIFELFPRLKERITQAAGTLSGGEQQMLSIGRALLTNPDLLILDEATEGLAPLIAQDIWRIIDVIKQSGISSVLVDKNFKALAKLSDRSVVMVKGKIVFDGSPNHLIENPLNLTKWLGV